MVKYAFFITFLFIFLINVTYAKDASLSCKEDTTQLTVYNRHDFKFISKSCNFEENPFVENFLISGKKKIFINKYSMDGGKWPQKLEAVSIYKNKVPVLITLHTQYWDTPTVNGITYSVNLYKILNSSDGVRLIDISKILGQDQSGLDGVSDNYMYFKFKNISSIKKWLDINYK